MNNQKPPKDVSRRPLAEYELDHFIPKVLEDANWVELDQAGFEYAKRQLKIELEASKRAIYLYPFDMVRFAKAIRMSREAVVPTLGYLDWIMRPTDAADARANLEEAFEQWVVRHGETTARRIFKWQGFRLAAGYIFDRAVDRLGQFAKLLRFGY